MELRPYDERDASAVDDLIDADSDPLWVAQGHTLHGVALDEGLSWRRTVVAEIDGRVVGAATIGTNSVHTREYNLAVEVAAPHRRNGIATALVQEVRALRRDPLVMAGKVRPTDVPGVALLRHFDGRVSQTCPGLRPDPCSAEIAAWCAAARTPTGVELRPLGDVAAAERQQLWIDQYMWVHERWAPADRAGLETLAAQLVAPADLEASSVDVEIDGHDADPHLAPVLATLPPCASAPLWLVTVG